MDPVELETFYSNEDREAFLDFIFDDGRSEEAERNLDRVREIMEDLPALEADFVDLYYFKHLKQTDIAHIFDVSQPTVCYRLQRAASRIKFLLSLPPISADEIECAMETFLNDPLDIEIMVLMFKTTCQSEVAKRLGVTQGLVRHRFMRTISKMDGNGDLEKYRDLFLKIVENLNILHDVRDNPIVYAVD